MSDGIVESFLAGGGGGEVTLDDFIGLPFIDPRTGAEGILKKFQAGRGQPLYYLDYYPEATAPAGQVGGQQLPSGSLIVDPRTRQSLTIGSGGMFTAQKLSDSDMSRMFGESFGGAAAAPAYSGTQAAQGAAFAHDQAMTNLQAELQAAESARDFQRSAQLQREILAEQQKFQAKQNRLAEEAALKRERFGVLQNLVEGFLQSQQRASEFMLQLQPDPFAFAAAAQGMPVMGTTPQAGYAKALTEYAQRPAPTLDPNAPLSAIEGGISTIMGQQMPLQPGMFGGVSAGGGMATGGTVAMPPLGQEVSFLVGEPRAPGEPNPEVITLGPAGLKVTPLAGGFQYGGGVDFDVSTVMQGLAPLYAGLGLEGIPMGGFYGGRRGGGITAQPRMVRFGEDKTVYLQDPLTGQLRSVGSLDIFKRSGFEMGDVENLPAGGMGEFTQGPRLTDAWGFRPELLSRLGVNPNLMRFGGDKTVYYRDPATGELRHMGSRDIFEQSNLNWGHVVNMAAGTEGAYTFGPQMTAPLSVTPPTSISPLGPLGMPAMSRPLAEGGDTRALLPSPYRIAAERRRLASVNPELYEFTKYAYGDPDYGLPRGALKTAEDIYTPSGMARGPIGFR